MQKWVHVYNGVKYPDRGYYRDYTKGEKIRRVAALVLLPFVGVGLISEKGLDIFGDADKAVSVSTAKARATARYERAFRQSQNPADKFSLQFLMDINIAEVAEEGGSGLFRNDGLEEYAIRFNNACLKSTAYDIHSSNAVLQSLSSNTVEVISNVSAAPPLRLVGSEDQSSFLPADSTTKQVFDSYGCTTGVTDIHHVTEARYANMNASTPGI